MPKDFNFLFAFCPFIHKVCNPASNWSLVVNPCIFRLVACRVACVHFIVYTILCIVFSIRQGYDPASDWSLVIEFHVVLLVTCRVACHTVLLHNLLAYTGDCASNWSLAIDFNTNVLVTCMVAWAVRGLLEKSSWESLIQLHQATRASAWSLAPFLMDVRVVTWVAVVVLLCTCIFHSGFWYPDVFNVLSVLLLIFLVVLNVCTVNKVSFVSFYPILALSFTCFTSTHSTAFLGSLGWIHHSVGRGVSWHLYPGEFQRFAASSEVPQHWAGAHPGNLAHLQFQWLGFSSGGQPSFTLVVLAICGQWHCFSGH